MCWERGLDCAGQHGRKRLTGELSAGVWLQTWLRQLGALGCICCAFSALVGSLGTKEWISSHLDQVKPRLRRLCEVGSGAIKSVLEGSEEVCGHEKEPLNWRHQVPFEGYLKSIPGRHSRLSLSPSYTFTGKGDFIHQVHHHTKVALSHTVGRVATE